MGELVLFGLEPWQEEIAADPWKWYVLRGVLLGFRYEAVWFVVLLTGMTAAVAYRRRQPAVARRVLIGCAGLFLVRLSEMFFYWLWTVIDPNPADPAAPLHRWPIWSYWDAVNFSGEVLFMLGQAGFLWLLVTAVLHGRGERSEGERE